MNDKYPYLTEDDEFDCENGSSVDLMVLVNSIRRELAAAQAEVERLRGIIRGAENIQQEWARQSIRVCCDSRPGDEHEPDCPFYQWEGTE